MKTTQELGTSGDLGSLSAHCTATASVRSTDLEKEQRLNNVWPRSGELTHVSPKYLDEDWIYQENNIVTA